MTSSLKDLLGKVAEELYDSGRHNEAELIETIAEGLRKVEFARVTYLQSEALSQLIEELPLTAHSHESYCNCERCPHCGEVIDA